MTLTTPPSSNFSAKIDTLDIANMKKQIIKTLCGLLPVSIWRKNARRYLASKVLDPIGVKESELAHHYLDGLNGIEIGASTQNSFGLDKTGGSYTTVDFEADQGGKRQASKFKPVAVDIVAEGDDLPFKSNTLDYVLSSHVIEHFFDPIKALTEWNRVIREGGYLFIIVPHKERTFDSKRALTSLDELIKRHDGTLKICDYCFMSDKEKFRQNHSPQGTSTSDNPHALIKDKETPAGWFGLNTTITTIGLYGQQKIF